MAKNQTWQVPTLVWERGQWLVDDIDLSHDPLTKYAPAAWKDHTWPMFVSDILKTMDTDPLPVRKKFVQMELDMTLAMFRAGVPFMAGTDTAAGVHIFPGFSLHQELALFVARGLDADAGAADGDPQSGQVHGPHSRTWERSSKASSRISCCSTPTRSRISPTRKKSARVVLAGRYFDRPALDRMLQRRGEGRSGRARARRRSMAARNDRRIGPPAARGRARRAALMMLGLGARRTLDGEARHRGGSARGIARRGLARARPRGHAVPRAAARTGRDRARDARARLSMPRTSRRWRARIISTVSRIIRVQDNYVVQWDDREPPPPRAGRRARRRSSSRPMRAPTARFEPLPDRDLYAPQVGFLDGFPAARDPRSHTVWLAHCYGMVGAGRDDPPESDGTEMYAVIGHAPRQLDRNVALVGRVLKGMELLSSLPRGSGEMGFYVASEPPAPIRSMRIAADVPKAERTPIEVLRTDSATFRAVLDAAAPTARAVVQVQSRPHRPLQRAAAGTRDPSASH